jgi:hypothetical protein
MFLILLAAAVATRGDSRCSDEAGESLNLLQLQHAPASAPAAGALPASLAGSNAASRGAWLGLANFLAMSLAGGLLQILLLGEESARMRTALFCGL